MRLMHRAAERRGRQLVPRPDRRCKRQGSRDHRGNRRARTPAPGATGVRRAGRCAGRVLHARDDCERLRLAAGTTETDRRGDQVLSRRQHLPMYRLQQDHGGRTLGGPGDARRDRPVAGAEGVMIPIDTRPAQGLIGTSPPRLDAWEKVTGKIVYAGDMTLPGMLHAKILWSAHPHALIRRIDTSAARTMPGVHAVLTHEDVPGPNRYGVAVLAQRVLAQGKVRSIGDAVALVAAESEALAEAALDRIVVEYEPLPGVFSIEAAPAPNAPLVNDGDDNLFQHSP